MNLIPLKTKERLRYHSGYYGSIVTIATGTLVTPNAPTKLCAKYELNATYDKEVIEVSLWSS